MNGLVNRVRESILKKTFMRFLLSGGINTATTWILYLALLNFIGYKASYTISYVVGIILAYAINRFFVFKSHRGISSVILFPFVYLFQYLFGLLIVWVWVEMLKMGVVFAPIISIVFSIPMTYFLTKYVFKGNQ